MKIGILSRNPRLYSTRRLVQASRERGHQVQVIDTSRCTMRIAPGRPTVHYRGKPLEGLAAVIPRISPAITSYGIAVIRQLETMGVYALNPSEAIGRSRDKLRALQLLAEKGIGIPVTGFAKEAADIEGLVEAVGGAPVVLKLLEGTQGLGVVLAESEKAAGTVIEAFMNLKAPLIVQHFVKEAGGRDLRCFVVGGQVIAAMERQGKAGEFRSNLHRGGTARVVEITAQERRTAVRAARAMGLAVAGVDILRASSGPLVLEVNSSPGLEGIERATGLDVAGTIIEFIEEQVGRPARRR